MKTLDGGSGEPPGDTVLPGKQDDRPPTVHSDLPAGRDGRRLPPCRLVLAEGWLVWRPDAEPSIAFVPLGLEAWWCTGRP